MRQAKKRPANALNLLAIVIFIIVFLVAFSVSLKVGLDRQAKADCLKWQSWDKQYILFEPSDDMLSQCITLGVDLKK